MPGSSSTTRIFPATADISSKPRAPFVPNIERARRSGPAVSFRNRSRSVFDLDEREEGDLRLGAVVVDPQVLALRRALDDLRELLRRGDRPAVDLRDDVPVSQVRVGRGRHFLDVLDEEAVDR